jgi:glycerate 2-kinase
MTPLAEQRALQRRVEGPALARVLSAALAAVDPGAAIGRTVEAAPHWLCIGGHVLPLSQDAGVWCVAVGKAAPVMAAALVRRIPASKLRGGVVVAKHAATGDDGLSLPVVLGAHPIPDERSMAAGRAVLDVLARVQPDDVVVVALSGGASSLMVAPAPGIELEDLRVLGKTLLDSGLPIVAINVVRKALDRLKGGGLLRHVAPARVATLVLSDVGELDPPSVVGSGPTLPDPAGRAAARSWLESRGIAAPLAVLRHLALEDDLPPPHATGPMVELASNATAVDAALAAARTEGWAVRKLPSLLGEARAAGCSLAQTLRGLQPSVPTLLVAGGETVVTMRGHGRGGRNQSLALAAMLELDGAHGTTLVTLATDGEDGPTDAAGAVVDGGSLARARALGLDPAARLDDDDAYPVFDALGDLLRIGPTGTNVCDLVLALARP